MTVFSDIIIQLLRKQFGLTTAIALEKILSSKIRGGVPVREFSLCRLI